MPLRRRVSTINITSHDLARGLAAVFLSEPSETPMDLRFWLFGVHIRVHPFFWLVAVVLGWNIADGLAPNMKFVYLGLWVVCVFVSILIHELGHVFMGRLFGSHGHIVLHGFGGLAIGSSSLNRGWQRFLVSFAGPLAQFALLGLTLLAWVFLLAKIPLEWRQEARVTLLMLIQINLFWPLLNLLPIWPLDGGQMTREVCVAVTPRNGVYASLGLSACVAGILALHCLMVRLMDRPLIPFLPFGDPMMALFFGYFCYLSFQGIQEENARRQQRYNHEDFPWER